MLSQYKVYTKKLAKKDFLDACHNGDLTKAVEIYDVNIGIVEFDLFTAFENSCVGGKLDIAQWLQQLETPDDIYFPYEWGFVMACSKGHLDIVKWLLCIKYDDIIYTINNINVFQHACKNGYLEICKLLLQVNPNIDISAMNEIAFTWACEFGHVEVAKWLNIILPYHYILEIENNQIVNYRIRSVKDRKWQQLKILIASHKYGNKTDLFYDLPYDLVRNICDYVL